MDQLEFMDLSTLQTVNLDELGIRLAGGGIINQPGWERVSSMMKSGGFREVLTHFNDSIKSLESDTDDLLARVDGLESAADQKRVTEIVEQNLPGNIKDVFAKLYTNWAEFDQTFLASSILSTELWYAANLYPSILPINVAEMAV